MFHQWERFPVIYLRNGKHKYEIWVWEHQWQYLIFLLENTGILSHRMFCKIVKCNNNFHSEDDVLVTEIHVDR